MLVLSAIRDLFDQYGVAYKMATRQEYALVSEPIRAPLNSEKPKQKVILHSAGGGQYRSFCYHIEKPKTIAEARDLTEEFIRYCNYNRLQLIEKTL